MNERCAVIPHLLSAGISALVFAALASVPGPEARTSSPRPAPAAIETPRPLPYREWSRSTRHLELLRASGERAAPRVLVAFEEWRYSEEAPSICAELARIPAAREELARRFENGELSFSIPGLPRERLFAPGGSAEVH